MAKSAEDFAAELVVTIVAPIAAIGVVIFFIQKILMWIWKSIAPYAIPILWGTGIFFLIGVVCFILLKRAGMNRAAWKSLVFASACLGTFGAVVYCGNSEKQSWAHTIVDSMRLVIEHPFLVGAIIVVFLILAVTIPIPGLGPVRNKAKSEFMRGFEDGMRDGD